ncbi:MAG: type II secretion system F family protein [Lentisphaerota bacterium]
MKTFEYKGFDASGHSSRGLLEALDIKDAREKLSALGILPERVAPAGHGHSWRLTWWDRRFNMDVRAMLYREMSSLLRAGLPLTQAMDVLIQAPEMGEHRSALAGVRDRIREGSSFGVALSSATGKLTPFEQAVIEVGERAGNLYEVLERLASFMEEQVKLRDRVQTALIYPSVVFCMALFIVVVMLGVMVPSLGRTLQESNIPLPWLTRVMILGGRWILPLLLPVLATLAAVIWIFRSRMKKSMELRARWNQKMFSLPLAGRAYKILVSLRFSRTLSLLLRGGVPLVECMSMAGKATGSEWVAQLSLSQAESVRHGATLSSAIRKIPPLSDSLPGWIQAGEASGRLEDLLDNAGDRYQQHWDRLIARGLSIMEPVLILIVGGFVLVISLSLLLPILQLNKSLM